MQSAAAAAVVPPNPNPYPNLNPMSSSNSNSNSNSTSQQQQQHHDNHQDPHRDSWYPYSNGTTHFDGNIAMILIFIISALVCALALNTAIRFFLRYSRGATANPTQHQLHHDHDHDHQHQNDDDQKLTTTTTTQSLWLPTLVFSSGTKKKLAGVGTGADDAAAECAICLSEFIEGEGVGILPKCKHGFHVKCIQGWLSSNVSCPTCRTTCLPPSPSPSPSPPPPPDNHHNYDVESPPLSASQLLQRPASE